MNSDSNFDSNFDFDFHNFSQDTMHDITMDVTDVLGKLCPEVHDIPIFNNMAIVSSETGNALLQNDLLYNQNFIWHIGQEYGNETIFGVVAHEIGHEITNQLSYTNDWVLSDHQKELCSDFISGAFMKMSNLNPQGMEDFFSKEAWQESESHPGGLNRIGAFEAGYQWASEDVFSAFEIRDSHSIQDILTSNVIDVFPAGES